MLIKSDKILEHKITLLNIKLDLINMFSFMTIVIINNKEFLVY